MARPSAFLFVGLLLLLAAALPASAAATKPVAPHLTSTNPPSPGAALRPFIIGDPEGGVVTSVVRRAFTGGSGPSRRAVDNPNFQVTIYAEDNTCSNPSALAAEGTAAELEQPGIQVDQDVKAGAETLFFAKQTDPTDPTNPSDCSGPLRYRHVSGPPEAPVVNATDPSSPADDNFPNVMGSAPVQTTVSIYDNATCTGAPLATDTVTTFEKEGIEVTVPANTTTTFHAKAKIAEYTSTCSTTSVTYQEVSATEEPGGGTPGGGTPGGETPPTGGPAGGGDSGQKAPDPKGRPPAPSLRTVPGYAANDNTPTVTGKAPGAGRVEIYGSAGCKGPVLAAGSAAQFAGAGLEVQVANDTVVTFYGVSIDGGDDRSPCSEAPAIYIEDSTAPHTRITSGPAAKTRKRKAIFRFADISGDTAASFLCKLDKGKWKACHAPLKLKGLGFRSHLLKVKAVDAAGNEEQGVAKRRFRVVRDY